MTMKLFLMALSLAPSYTDAAYAYTMRHEEAECGSQSSNLGAFSTPALCAAEAGSSGCTSFMFSSEYNVWGCRCCADPDGGNQHALWDVYNVVDCSATEAVCVLPGDQLIAAVLVAQDFCKDPDPLSNAKKYESAALELNDVVAAVDAYLESDDDGYFASALANATTLAAAVLATQSGGGYCSAAATACNKGAVLQQQVRSLLALSDGNATRAFADSEARALLFDRHGVMVGDALWLDAESVAATHAFFDLLPPHLMSDGILAEAPFATMTIRDAFRCSGEAESISLTATARAFNIFQSQVGSWTENAFGGTRFPLYGDGAMTVIKHETAHQFDRVVRYGADAVLEGMFGAYIAAASDDEDWLRSSVGNIYFQRAPQEIIASQVGNQFLLSSSNQLALALDRLATSTSALPLAWFLYHLEIFSRR